MSALNSSVVLAATTIGAKLFQWGILLWEKRILKGINRSLEPAIYCDLCDDLVDLLRDGVKYLSLSIDIIPQ